MKRKLLPLLLTVVLVVAAALVPMLGITAAAEETTETVAIAGTTGTINGDKEISWTSNDVTFTNVKGSTAFRTSDSDHYRVYAGSTVTISAPGGISEIVITCTSSSYATVMQTSATNSGYTATLSGSNVTITCTDSPSSITFTASAQTRLSKVVVTYTTGGDSGCEHANTTETRVEATKGEAGSITVTCDDCHEVISEEVIDALGWTSTFVTPEGVAAPIVSDDLEITMPTPDPLPEGVSYMYAYEFAGWAKAEIDGETTETPELYNADDKVTLTADTTFYAVYRRAEGGTGESGWIETAPSAIKPENLVVIVWTKTGGTYYAPSNDNGTESAPAAVSVTVSNGKITSKVADNIKWNVSYDSGKITIYPNGTTATWMYCTNTNNGVRVGTNADKTFVIDGDYLKHEAQGRYLGIYNAQDLRCYTTSTTTNIANQTVAFYVYTESGTAYYTTTLETTECDHSNATTVTVPATCTEPGSITTTCDCGYEKIDSISPIGHSLDNGEITKEPTCTDEGEMTYSCQNDHCDYTETEVIDPLGHNFVNGECSVCHEIEENYSGRYYIATQRSKGNSFFFMTSDLGPDSTKRYQATDSGLAELPEEGYFGGITVFVIEKNEDGTYCIYAEGVEGDNYLGYTSGNSGTFVAQADALKLTIDVTEDGLYNIHFAASDAERYLSLNASSNSNYFAFYKGTQKQDLSLVTAPSANIDGATVSAGADLSVNYYVTLVGYNANDLVAKITMNGKTVDVLATVEDGKVFFKFTGIAPQQMGDNIEFVLYLGEQEIASYKTYSVATNLKNLYNDAESSAELKALVSDMLYYGAAAQKFTGYKTAELVTAGFEGAQSTNELTFDEYDRRVTETKNTAYYFKSAGVQFDSQNRVYVKIVAPSIEGLTVTVDGVALELEEIDEGMYIAYSAGLSATDLDTQLTFILTLNGEQIQELSYSANGYIYMMRNDAQMKELVVALFNYGKSAEAFKAAPTENN